MSRSASSRAPDLIEGRVSERFLQLWLPMIGGVISVKCIGIADSYFAGQLGADALAAISFTFPVVMTLISLAIGLSAGTSSILSRALGDGASDDTAQEIVAGALAMAFVAALIFGLLGWFSAPALMRLVGASDDALTVSSNYMRIWFAGLVFLIGPVVANGIFRSHGDGRTPAILMSAVALINVALDPVFMFGLGLVPELGVEGAAVATIVARALGTLAALGLMWKRQLLSLNGHLIRKGLARWRAVLRIGAPAAASTSLNPIALSIATAAVATVGDDAVAAFGTATKIQSLAVTPLLALSAASAPFAGQNSGAGKPGRTRSMLKFSALIAIIWSVIAAAFLFVAGEPIAAQFTESDAVRELISFYLLVVPLSYAGYGVVISLSAALNGVDRPFRALGMSGGRAILLLAPSAWIGVTLFGFQGVPWGFFAANITAGLIAAAYIFRGDISERSPG